MVTQVEGVKWATDRIGARIDVDKKFGSQCMDFVVQYGIDLFGWEPTGDAISLWSQGLPPGFQRISNTANFIPQPGDVFVNTVNGHAYGHTGVIIQADINGFTAIEQNGGAGANLTHGTPAEQLRHNYNGFLGVIRPPFSSSIEVDGCIDSFTITDSDIKVNGWHVSAKLRDNLYSYLFIMDADTGKELTRYGIQRDYRPDVHNIYPTLPLSVFSGFSFSTPIPKVAKGKRIKIMSRYASSSDGNIDVSDFTFPDIREVPSIRNRGVLDVFTAGNTMISVNGWHISDGAGVEKYPFIFILDESNNEICRYAVHSTQRLDVAQSYPDYPNVTSCGFNLTIPIPAAARGKNIRIMSRYANTIAGEGGTGLIFPDLRNVPVARNSGSLDVLTVTNTTVSAHGWHATDVGETAPYRFIFIMDAHSGNEICRFKVTKDERLDVDKLFPDYPNARFSGFNLTFDIPDIARGKSIKIMSSYSESENGEIGRTSLLFAQVKEIPMK